MAVKTITNIAGGISRSNIVKLGIGDSLNMFPEVQNINEYSSNIIMRSIKGETKFADIPGRCRGLYRVSRGINEEPALYAVYNDKLYLIKEDGNIHVIGKLDTVNGEVHMTETSGYGESHPHLALVDGFDCYVVNTGLSVPNQVNDFRRLELPLRANESYQRIQPTHIAYLYNYLVVNDSGTDAFYISYQYPLDAPPEGTDFYDVFMVRTEQYWNYGFAIYSEWCPDNTLALCSNGSKLYTFGSRSWQAFSHNDDINYPFSSPDNAAGNIGIKAPNSLAMLGNTVLWLGSSDIGENGVFMVKDTTLTRVSTNDIEREIGILNNPENAYSSIWEETQHVFYSITFEDSDITYVYDITEGYWHRRSSYDDNNDQRFWRYGHATFAYNRIFVGTDDALCYMDENKFEEHDGRKILKMRRGGVITNSHQPFYIDAIDIIVNNGQVGYPVIPGNFLSQTGIEGNPRISIRYTWDGATWSDYGDTYLGKVGNYDWTATFWHLGMGKYFTLEISTTEKIPLSIESLNIQYEPCAYLT